MFTDKEELKTAFVGKLQDVYGKILEDTTTQERYAALAGVIRDQISRNWIKTNRYYASKQVKQVYYFSIEFLLGKLLACNLVNMGIRDLCDAALKDLGIELNELLAQEPDAGLGNGGLGRLAACFMDSLAALGMPGHGCGIRYRYGLFEQKIVDNHQVELPDNWLKENYVWEFRKADKSVIVRFGGNVYPVECESGRLEFVYENAESIRAVPYDIPMIGYENNTVNTLRLWNAETTERQFDLSSFGYDEYMKAVRYRHSVEKISKILYPDDSTYEGRLLRLKQQYFFTSAGLQSIVRRFKRIGNRIHDLPEKVLIHINDTHPAVAVPELMRLLLDEERLEWEDAWAITTRTISYTNHTILPEALERWPIDMFRGLLPRIYMIIEEIHRRFTDQLQEQGVKEERMKDMSILWGNEIHMARLAVIGSHSVNGVAQLHTEILKGLVFRDFDQLYPGKFNNKTNGITHRRWLIEANPGLADLISESIPDTWRKNPHELIRLKKYADDAAFQDRLAAIKRERKQALAAHIRHKYGVKLDVDSIFDAQIKRIHSYKRQILNILHVMHLYHCLRDNPAMDMAPRTFIFGGKAAPGYYVAKQTIRLINTVAEMVNKDRSIQDKLKVIFMENYSVSLGEMVFPAADVSEQISTASKEASGTGNMKFMMNGALTLGTLDGANVEIEAEVGADNIVIFGLRAREVLNYYENGGYSAWDIYHSDARIRTVLEQLVNGFFPGAGDEFRRLYDGFLADNDEFFVLKDFDAYAAAQVKVAQKYRMRREWLRSSTINIAHSGNFSSDRTIAEYARDIWRIDPIAIP